MGRITKLITNDSIFDQIESWLKKHNWAVILVIASAMVVSLFLRWRFIADHQLFFWYDQPRDAIIADQMWHHGDLKLMGPSASGTADSVYHGVLYYYFIAPLYGLSGGNPQAVAFGLAVLFSLGLITYYLFAKDVSDSRLVGLVAVIFAAVSARLISLSLFLVNPTLALGIFPLFYWALWKIFFRKQSGKWIVVLAVCYGLLIQSALWLFPIGLIIPVLWYQLLHQDEKYAKSLLRPSTILKFVLPTTLLISTMILTQFKLWKTGIFTLDKLALSGQAHQIANNVQAGQIMGYWFTQLREMLIPTNIFWGLLLTGIILSQWKYFMEGQRKLYFWLLLSPLFILLIQGRDNEHFLFGTEYILILIFVQAFLALRWKLKPFLVIGIFGLTIISQLSYANYFRNNHEAVLDHLKTTLSDQLMLVDETYQKAHGQPFTISSYASPYLYNTLWSYLYNWYGLKKYGYKPAFVGKSQVGLINEGMLDETVQVAPLHFAIVQPSNPMSENYKEDFFSQQTRATGMPATGFAWFGTIQLFTYSAQDYQLKQSESTQNGQLTPVK